MENTQLRLDITQASQLGNNSNPSSALAAAANGNSLRTAIKLENGVGNRRNSVEAII